MKLSSLFFLLFFSHVLALDGQDNDLDRSKINFTIKDTPTLIHELQILESYDLDDIHPNSFWAFYLFKSHLHFYLGEDSVLHNIELAFTHNTRAVCNCLLDYEELFLRQIKLGREPADFSWFLWDLPDEIEADIRQRCKVYKDEMDQENARIPSQFESYIMSNDQKSRGQKETNWLVQDSLDLVNREYLDSLYTKHQSFEPFNSYELDAFSFVIHHSNDCTWNEKWILIWLNEISKGNASGGKLFGTAIERMLEPHKGVCWKRDQVRTQAFIAKLKEKYTNKLAIEYGYDGY